jgi:hypothetical protein
MEGYIMNDLFRQLKVWGVAMFIGIMLGGFIKQEWTFKAIEQDCKVLKAFRIYNKAYDCKEKV